MKTIIAESKTLDAVLADNSIARYGDGEFNLLRGRYCCSQKFVPGLDEELKQVLTTEQDGLIVAIPRISKDMPEKKRVSWMKWWKDYANYVNDDKQYYSAFITRPDQVTNFATPEYYERVRSLWADRDVCLVWGGYRSLYPDFVLSLGARSVSSVLCSFEDTYGQVDYLEKAALETNCKTVILCAGATGTVLAARLARSGVQGVDAGHLGLFWEDHPLAPSKVQPPSEAMSKRMRTQGAVRYVQSVGQHRPFGDYDPMRNYMAELQHAESLAHEVTPGEACVIDLAGAGALPRKLSKKFKRVYAFEPNPAAFGALRRNITESNIWFFPYALGDSVGPAPRSLYGEGCMQTTLQAMGLQGLPVLYGRNKP